MTDFVLNAARFLFYSMRKFAQNRDKKPQMPQEYNVILPVNVCTILLYDLRSTHITPHYTAGVFGKVRLTCHGLTHSCIKTHGF